MAMCGAPDSPKIASDIMGVFLHTNIYLKNNHLIIFKTIVNVAHKSKMFCNVSVTVFATNRKLPYKLLILKRVLNPQGFSP